MFCANMIHIAPWRCCQGLLHGAGKHLPAEGKLVIYGPFRFNGSFTAPSNARFDANLRRQNEEWGVRDIADIEALADQNGLQLADTIAMPANNHLLVLRAAASKAVDTGGERA